MRLADDAWLSAAGPCLEGTVGGLAQAYVLADRPGHGAEVFSLMRDSVLDPDAYVDRFFDTGTERQRTTQR